MTVWDRIRVFFMGERDKDKGGGNPHQLDKISDQLDTIISLLTQISSNSSTTTPVPPDQSMEDIMTAVSDLTDAVNRQSSVIDSARTLLGTLAQQIRDNVDNSAALQQLAADIEANTDELAQAVDANDGEPNPPVEEQPPVDETTPPVENPDDQPHPDQTLPGDLPQ